MKTLAITARFEYGRQRRMGKGRLMALWCAVSYALEPLPF